MFECNCSQGFGTSSSGGIVDFSPRKKILNYYKLKTKSYLFSHLSV